MSRGTRRTLAIANYRRTRAADNIYIYSRIIYSENAFGNGIARDGERRRAEKPPGFPFDRGQSLLDVRETETETEREREREGGEET